MHSTGSNIQIHYIVLPCQRLNLHMHTKLNHFSNMMFIKINLQYIKIYSVILVAIPPKVLQLQVVNHYHYSWNISSKFLIWSILKQNFQKTLKKCDLSTTCIVIYVAGSSLQHHNSVLPLLEGVKLKPFQYEIRINTLILKRHRIFITKVSFVYDPLKFHITRKSWRNVSSVISATGKYIQSHTGVLSSW